MEEQKTAMPQALANDHESLQGKTILLGVSGSIAAYKAAYLASALHKRGCDVHVLMTANACQFINPITFETLTDNKCLVDTFDRNFQYNVEHVSLAKRADLCLLAPASANLIARLAYGMADDMLTTTVLACSCPKLVAPAMNTGMLQNPITQDNLARMERFGCTLIQPAIGYLACGDTGAGKFPEPEVLLEHVYQQLCCPKDLAGVRVLVTAGPTREAVDPVRFLSNRSSGKMGYAVARAASLRGAQVTLVSGPTALEEPPFVQTVQVTSAREMFEAVTSRAGEQDIIIKAAAVADYRPAQVYEEKIKKGPQGDLNAIELERTDDILAWLGAHKTPGQFLCGFSMETQNVEENSRAKLYKKNVDMIAANSLRTQGAGFAGDTNVLTLITRDGARQLEKMSKREAAHCLLDEIQRRRNGG